MINRRKIVIGAAAVALSGFAGSAYIATKGRTPEPVTAVPKDSPLVRPHSPTFGPDDAPVTIVEFFDPACEACRAFHPVVKQIMATFPDKVRLVLRYAAVHAPSAEAITILETARMQNRFEPVLEALYEGQPIWAPHGRTPGNVWDIAAKGGLDVKRAKKIAKAPGIVATLNQDAADIATLGVRKTPTFFVNGKPLREFGAQQLFDLVKSEVEANRN
jgi:protein-disulfide isomerase